MTDESEGRAVLHKKPLITFALLTYNQEKYIREAVEGALSQDYCPLEIIISDDLSSDNTVEIIANIVNNYCGPHTLVINVNKTNIGLGGHVNLVMKMSAGELVVLAAGDDISDSRRVSLLVEAWEEAGRPAALCSQAKVISMEGELISERYDGYDGRYPCFGEKRSQSITRLLEADHCLLLGCTEAWMPHVFDIFGPLDEAVVHEDNAVSLRAWLLSNIIFLDMALVQYRTHLQNIAYRVRAVPKTVEQFTARENVYAARQNTAIAHLQQHATDLQTAFRHNLISKNEYLEFSALLSRRLRIAEIHATWWKLSIRKKCMALLSATRLSGFSILTWGLPRLAGLYFFSLGRAFVAFLSRVRRNFLNRLKLMEFN